MKSIVRGGGAATLVAGTALALAACGSFDGKSNRAVAAAPATAPADNGVSDVPVKLGDPYTIAGTTYTPADVADYDDVGYASWYGEEAAGKPTANGEIYNPDGISAAHKTLPLPSYVEVTALDTGRTILVRVNDRGPISNDRLIDLSRGAAAQLGLTDAVSAVRVRRTNPPAAERAQLRAGRPVPERLATPESLLSILRTKIKQVPVPKAAAATVPDQPAPPTASAQAKPGDDRMAVTSSKKPEPSKPAPAAKPATPEKKAEPAPKAVTGSFVVQVGAFSSEARANVAAKSVGGHVDKAGKLWRVRMGPFASDGEAKAAQDKAKAKGFRDATVLRDR